MAPVEEVYFPRLEACLSGNLRLISWRIAFDCLSDNALWQTDPSLLSFLSSDSSLRLLTDAISGFSKPSSKSRSGLEIRTAAINIATASQGHYVIEEIKEDALWLSKEVDIDEIEALRIVTVEWQNRPRNKLHEGLSENERASLRGPLDLLSSPGPLSRYLDASVGHRPSKPFLSAESRRTRLLTIYLEERRCLLGTYEKLVCIALSQEIVQKTSKGGLNGERTFSDVAKPIQTLGRSILKDSTTVNPKSGLESYVVSYIDAMLSRLDSLEHGNSWHKPPDPEGVIEANWITTNLHELIMLSDLLLLKLRWSRRIAKSPILLRWFQMVSKYNFFTGFQAQSEKQAYLVSLLQISIATTSTALLDPATSISYLLESQPTIQNDQDVGETSFYFFDLDNVGEIQEIFFNLAGACIPLASPAVFAWGIVLYTIRELGLSAKETREGQHVQKALESGVTTEHQQDRRLSSSSLGSTQQSIYEDIVDQVRAVSLGEDPVGFLTQSSIDGCRVFDIIANIATAPLSSISSPLPLWRSMTLIDLVKVSFDSIGYTPETMTATLAILDGDQEGVGASQIAQSGWRTDLASSFTSDDFLMTTIYDTSLARFPYEALPFLKLCKALAPLGSRENTGNLIITERLKSLDTFTQVMPPGFSRYRTIREEENANLVSLEQSLDKYTFAKLMLLGDATGTTEAHDLDRIPYGAIGQVISDTKPTVIMWYHNYSGLAFLGKCLQLYQNGQEVDCMSQADPSDAVAMAIIELFTCLVYPTNQEAGCNILEEASDGLLGNSDIVHVIFELLEQQIQGLRYKRASDGVLRLCAACVEFINAVVTVTPGKVWPLLARSSLLNLNGAGSLLLAVVSTEATPATIRLLETSVDLHAKLLEDAITSPMSRKDCCRSREYSRLLPMMDAGAPTHVMTKVLLDLTQAMAEIYDSLSSSQFKAITFQAQIRTNITRTFRNLLGYAFGIDDNDHLAAKLSSITSMAAPYVFDFFLPDSPSDTNLGAIIQVLVDGLQEEDALHQEILFQIQVEQTGQSLWLCYDLIRAARLKDTVTFLERQLCQIFPVLIRLYEKHVSYQIPCLKLMSELVAIGSTSETDSSSLLSFLGIESSTSLLEMLSTLDSPRSDTLLYVTIWEFLTSLLSVRQRWFAVYLLTGSSPKEKLKDDPSTAAPQRAAIRGKAFLTIALDDLSHIESVQGERAAAMLSFACRAQENWPWATSSLQAHRDFFAGVMAYIGKLAVKQGSVLEQCYQHKIAARMAELSIVYLHSARSNRDYSIVKKMLPAFKWYTKHAVETPFYNSSLHANLRKNFGARYQNCDILRFKKTAFYSPKYGDAFFYDTRIAAKMLSFDSSWSGTPRSPGFAHEFELANLNLSLVDSQMQLLQSFRGLCIEHAAVFVQDREVQKLMAQIVRNCLTANSRICPAEKLFESLFQTRIELALGLLHRLVDIKARGSEFTTLLGDAWETTRFRNGSYDTAISNNDLGYYRSCLATLLLCIQLHAEKHQKPQPSNSRQNSHTSTRSIILEILSNVVAQGLGQISSALHDQVQSQRPSTPASEPDLNSVVVSRDFSLLLSILQTSIRVNVLAQIVAQVSSVFISSNIIKSAVRLYSWSHCLTPANADPIYSSYALSFLVALSSLPPVAEELGIEGVMGRLGTSRMTLTLQTTPGGVGPFEPTRGLSQYPHQQRLYAIWAEGILPLSLNLLQSVGRPMAGEIATFLNQFPEQLGRASSAFAYNAASKDPNAGAVSLSLAAEATTLALISHILSTYRIAGASAGVDSFDIPILGRYDEPENRKALKADLEELLNRKAFLKSRIVATSEKDLLWAKSKSAKTVAGDGENVLEAKIVAELKSALVCVKGNELGEDES